MRLGVLALTGVTALLLGCDSGPLLSATPSEASVLPLDATLSTSSGQTTLAIPLSALPQALQGVSPLEVIAGGVSLTGFRAETPGGTVLAFLLPAAALPGTDAAGKVRVILSGGGTRIRLAELTITRQ